MPLSREQVFLLHALGEARQAIDAFNRAIELSRKIEEVAPGTQRREWLSVWQQIRLGLQISAGVSRVFWPAARSAESRQLAEERAASLRAITGLPASSTDHVLGNRAWRDYVEHLDERIDARLAKQAVDALFSYTVLHDDAVARVAAPVSMMTYDKTTATLDFGGESYSLTDLIMALEGILTACGRGLSPG